MTRLTTWILVGSWLWLWPAMLVAGDREIQNWPQWRGPLGTGAAPNANPPTEWSEIKNVRWKTALPGVGHSTPVIWGDLIFVSTAMPYGKALKPRYSGAPGAHDNLAVTHRHRFVVLGVRRSDGKILWQQKVRQDLPHAGGHNSGSLASNSPVTDGEHVFAFFGSHGLYCLDLAGKVQWTADFGEMQTKHGHGEGSSPVLHGNTVVVNWDHEDQSFVVALDKRNGNQLWKRKRDEVTSWATPIVVVHGGQPQLVICGTSRVRGYDLKTGDVIWECSGLSANIVATPVEAGGMLFAGSSYEKKALLAIQLDGAQGDITETGQVVWRRFRGTPYVPSPLLYEDSLYFLAHYQNILTRVNATTGADYPGAMRLGGIRNVYASPVAAAGRVYITDLEGSTLVISHADRPEVLALNRLNDSFSASAAVVDRELFLRGQRYLYCIAEESPNSGDSRD